MDNTNAILVVDANDDASRRKILLIDDDQDMREIGRKIIEAAGYKFFAAPNGKLGLEMILAYKPDLILLDYMMPRMGGAKVFQELISSPLYRPRSDTPVIMLTAKSEYDVDRNRLFELGLSAFLVKPFGHRELINVIDNVFILHQVRQKNRELEQRIRRTEYKYQDLIENANDLIFTLSLKGDFIFINRRLSTLTGYAREEWISKSILELVHPEDHLVVVENLQLALRGKARIFEIRVICPNAMMLFLSTNINPIFEKNEVIGTVGIARDITHRKYVEQEILGLKKFYESIIQNIDAGIITLDLGKKITSFNRLAEQITGYSTNEVTGKHLDEIMSSGDAGEELSNFIDDTGSFSHEMRISVKDGKKINIGFTITSRMDNSGKKVGLILIFRDITQSKILTEKLNRLSKSLEDAYKYSIEYNYDQMEPNLEQIVENRFIIKGKIGNGSESTVFKAHDSEGKLGDEQGLVAIKWLNKKNKEVEHRWCEGYTLVQTHDIPGLCKIYQVYNISDPKKTTFIVMQYLYGETLDRFIQNTRRKPDIREIKELVSQFMRVVHAVIELHESAHIVHRDIKPSNIMRDEAGNLTIIDMGLARERKEINTVTSDSTIIKGTWPYLPPEEFHQQEYAVFDKYDIYSLGATLYELLTFECPFPSHRTQSFEFKKTLSNYKKAFIPPERYNPAIPVTLSKIIQKCMDFNPEKRYPNVRALYNELTDWLEGKKISVVQAPLKREVRIFISYVEEDHDLVRNFVSRLEEYGFIVWAAFRDSVYGKPFIQEIEDEINKCNYFFACCTPAYIKKDGWQKREIQIALLSEKKNGKPEVIPIILKECDIEGFLGPKNYCNLSNSEKFTEQFENITNWLTNRNECSF